MGGFGFLAIHTCTSQTPLSDPAFLFWTWLHWGSFSSMVTMATRNAYVLADVYFLNVPFL